MILLSYAHDFPCTCTVSGAHEPAEGAAYYGLHVLCTTTCPYKERQGENENGGHMPVKRTSKPAIIPVESRKTRDPRRIAQMGDYSSEAVHDRRTGYCRDCR